MMRKQYLLLMIVVLTPLLGISGAFSNPGKSLWQAEGLTAVSELTELTTEDVPVEPGKKLEITFSGQTTGDFTVEKNARIRTLNTSQVGSMLILQFFDAQGQRLEEIMHPILTESLHRYGRVIYPPSEAAFLKIFLVAGSSGEVTVENLRLTQALEGVEAESVNPHPVFRYGDLNSYGMRSGYGGGFFERPDGKTVWNTGFTGQTSRFAVQGGDSYALFGRGVGYAGKRSKILLQLFEEGAKKPFHTIRLKMSPEGESMKALLPEGAVSANFLGYYMIAEELKIVKSAQSDSQK